MLGARHLDQALACSHGQAFGLFVVVLMAAWAPDRFVEIQDDRRIAAFCDSIEGDVVLWIKHDTIQIVASDLERFSLDCQAQKSPLYLPCLADAFLSAREGQDFWVFEVDFTVAC